MFHAAQPGVCVAGGGHEPQPNRELAIHTSTGGGRQEGWRWCKRCGVVFYQPGGGRCAAGGGHDGSSSAAYTLGNEENTNFWATGLRWCRNCQCLFADPGGKCPLASGPFGSPGAHNASGSSPYALIVPVTGDGIAVVYEGKGDSGKIWMTIRQNNAFRANVQIPGGCSGTPTAAMHEGKLWILYRGQGNSKDLWYTTYDGAEFSASQQVPDVRLAGSPSACASQGDLHVFLQGTSDAKTLWLITHRNGHWYSSSYRDVHLWNDPAAVSVRFANNDVDVWGIYDRANPRPTDIAQGGYESSGSLQVQTVRGWSGLMTGTRSAGSPAAVFYRGKVWVFHEDSQKHGELYCNTITPGSDAKANLTYANDVKLPCGISAVVAPVVEGNNLLVFHEGPGDSGELWFVTYDGQQNKWLADARVANFGCSTGCAAANFTFMP